MKQPSASRLPVVLVLGLVVLLWSCSPPADNPTYAPTPAVVASPAVISSPTPSTANAPATSVPSATRPTVPSATVTAAATARPSASAGIAPQTTLAANDKTTDVPELVPTTIRVPQGSDAQTHTLRVPEGFAIEVIASGLKEPRFMAFDPAGNLVVG